MTRRTKKLGIVGIAVIVCAASGVVLGHAVTNTAEVKVDCLIFSAATTGQTSCPGGVTIAATTHQIFTVGIVGNGGISTDCSNVISSISPTFATLQGLGPFHAQIPQFNNTATGAASTGDSGKSFGSGGTVTYSTTSPFTLTDTSKAFPASFNSQVVMAVDPSTNPITAWTGTVGASGVSGNTLTLGGLGWTTTSLTNHPPAGARYQVEPCMDTLGGHTMTVTTNGWTFTTLDAAGDEGATEGPGASPQDTVNVGVPVLGAEVFEDLAQCDIKVNPTGTALFQVNASTNDSSTITVAGTVGGSDHASNIPISVTGTPTCPTSATVSAYTGTIGYFVPGGTTVSPITDG